jgi:hypothetical protein
MLSSEGWLHGIVSVSVVIIYYYFGLYFMNKSKKANAKLLFALGIMIIFTGSVYLRISSDFLTVVITGNNSNFPYFIHFILGWIWAPISGGTGLYIATELLIPKKKWYVLSIFTFLLTLLFVVFLVDPSGSVKIVYPINPGEELVENQIIAGSNASLLIYSLMVFTISFGGFGTLVKGIQSKGVIRKKFFSLSTAWFLTHIFIALEAFAKPGLSTFYKFGYSINS